MKQARFVQTVEELDGLNAEERAYVGHPTCARLAWGWVDHLPVQRPVTLVLPPLRPRDDARLRSLLEKLRQMPDCGLELSLNDWGTLALCALTLADTPVKVCAGLLLAAQDTDPRIASFLTGAGQETREVLLPDGTPARLEYAPPPDALRAHWQTPSILGALPLLRSWGVSRVELCAQPAGLLASFPPDMAVSLYRPFALLTVFPCGDCAACPKDTKRLGNLGGSEVFQSRAMGFVRMEEMEIPDYVDRCVWFANM